MPSTLSARAARRIALAAQGFADRRPAGAVTARHLRRAIAQLGLLQLDSVNVFSRTHYVPLFSRLGPYPRDALDRMAAHTDGRVRRELFEYWAHEASLVPLALQPHLRWRMARAGQDAWGGVRRIASEQPELVARVKQLVRERGPIRAGETDSERAVKQPGEMWNWHDGKVALEWLFWSGQVTAARRINFERRYDLMERVLPPALLEQPTPPVEESQRELLRVAARAHGVATEPDLGDYFRLPRRESKLRVAELVEAGELEPVTVEGWDAPAYLWPQARKPRRVEARALLSPFDSLIWFRPRTERIFGFHYRIEIYTPQPKRVYGYYVLPFLLGDALVGRVDLKSDRQAGLLRVQGAYLEAGAEADRVAPELAAELAVTAAWLGLENGVVVGGRGDLAAPLRAAVCVVQ
ncbi:crosslink repair DNA glycosylase YcaQ family protein [Conexibacter sp. JD483]|uniref:winged helix-turn-helix domain-containing protein n=1 Tax=unclassified Conexibacter TaxID=2627773 RepID=UPI00271E7104|nr:MULTISPECIES: crosslink repair DNA glycosylase YcaQ family protein [unclassified Conexibacter]MDO8185605.1 crosslink repair DNA glycosylase YcaQ family protein [Conexibacter sp. CPCC 205706]MDO8198778.1 crosslink repair DNA glycosylase YcaQ family protein [Conexibacter sp. CPCC 205762]MDR9367872.1 crosslink repair DNA glycosylase YcaQ family protein [Conexibacter sp. JD483]